jgi:putative copper export protein
MSLMLAMRLVMRIAHVLAAAMWVGGSMIYVAVVQPALRSGGGVPSIAAQIAAHFKQMVNICVGVLLLSGAYLVFDRLTQTTLGAAYIIVLVIKIALALGMFGLASYLGQNRIRRLAKRTTRFSKLAPQLMLAIGIVIFVLGALLNALFEVAIAPR